MTLNFSVLGGREPIAVATLLIYEKLSDDDTVFFYKFNVL